MSKQIALTNGYFATVDDKDLALVAQYKWYAHWTSGNVYAVSTDKSKIEMHRLIMGFPPGKLVLHLDDDGLNNIKSNLLTATAKENSRNNTRPNSNTSGVRGVSFQKANRKYKAYITHAGEQIYLGLFSTLQEAIVVRKAAEVKYWMGCSSLYPPSKQSNQSKEQPNA